MHISVGLNQMQARLWSLEYVLPIFWPFAELIENTPLQGS